MRTIRPYDFVFIIDPLETLVPAHDTSVALMEAAQSAGHRVLVTTIADLALTAGQATARCREIRLRLAVVFEDAQVTDTDWYIASPPRRIPLNTAAAVFMRTDPPVEARYLRATFILDFVDPATTLLINSPAGLRAANEKIFALRLPEFVPETVVSADREEIVQLVRRWGNAVLKPTDGMAGRGVLLLRSDDPNLRSLLDTATVRGRDHVIVQKYLPAAAESGDRRVIVLDGAPIGALRRLAGAEDFRCNMAAGARVRADTVRDRDRAICRRLGPELVSRGLYFAGIDIIGDMLIEVNVTSPTGIREIDALSGTRLAAEVIDWVGRQCAARERARSTPST
ncbi:glutathione synthase [Nocardia sp. 004]|uniref:glutathione synthase n=1 Tax=Nocardia sp. 004 TaxID=3385978 RepID=UPI0039A341D4